MPKTKYCGFQIFTHRCDLGLSYSIYLWHWGVISISRWTIGIHWWTIPFLVICIFFIAKISYEFIEKPIRYSRLFSQRYLAFGAGGIIILLALIQSLSFLKLSEKMYMGSPIEPEKLSENQKQNRPCDDDNFRFIFVGDSHAGHFLPAKKHACNSYGVNIDILAAAGTPFLLLFTRIHFTALVLPRKIALRHLQAD